MVERVIPWEDWSFLWTMSLRLISQDFLMAMVALCYKSNQEIAVDISIE